jgi:hypothetical protein
MNRIRQRKTVAFEVAASGWQVPMFWLSVWHGNIISGVHGRNLLALG